MNHPIDARSDLGKMLDEYKGMKSQLEKLTILVSQLNERVESLEADRDAAETSRMEQLERQ